MINDFLKFLGFWLGFGKILFFFSFGIFGFLLASLDFIRIYEIFGILGFLWEFIRKIVFLYYNFSDNFSLQVKFIQIL